MTDTFTPLNQEQLNSIEANNKLLKIFAGFLETNQTANPGIDFDASACFAFFMLGARAVQNSNQSVTMAVAKDMTELQAVFLTQQHYAKQAMAGASSNQGETSNEPT